MVFIAIAVGEQTPRLRRIPLHVRVFVRGASSACAARSQQDAQRPGERQFGHNPVMRVLARCIHTAVYRENDFLPYPNVALAHG